MPTYEYACTRCGAHIEVVQRFDDEPLRTCQRCGGDVRKVFHPAGIVFRGSGFYATDSRAAPKDGSKDGAKKDAGKKEGTSAASSKPESSSAGGAKEKSA